MTSGPELSWSLRLSFVGAHEHAGWDDDPGGKVAGKGSGILREPPFRLNDLAESRSLCRDMLAWESNGIWCFRPPERPAICWSPVV